MRWGHSTIYPNNYIILVGPSGQARKGDPISICRNLLEDINISLIAEDNSEEAVIQDIKRSLVSIPDPLGMRFQCAVSCCVEELAVLTGYQNSRFLAYLTNWYDSRDKWIRRTKHQGTDEVTGMCFNLFAATAPDWIPHILTSEAIGGGFTSRVIFVVEEGKEKVISNPNLVPLDTALRKRLLYDLEHMNTFVGEYKFSTRALEMYEAWYIEEERKIREGEQPLMVPTFAGYVSRRPTHLKKIAMAIAASYKDDLVIDDKDLGRALDMLIAAEDKMPKAFATVGRSSIALDMDAISRFIEVRKTVKKSQLLATFWRDVDEQALEGVINVLYGMHKIDIRRQPGLNDTVYEWVFGKGK